MVSGIDKHPILKQRYQFEVSNSRARGCSGCSIRKIDAKYAKLVAHANRQAKIRNGGK